MHSLYTSRLRLGLFPLAFTSCCCGIACSWERLPVLQQLGPHQALGVEKNRDLLWLTYARGAGGPGGDARRKEGEGWGLGPEGLGPCSPGATCHDSALLSGSALPHQQAHS